MGAAALGHTQEFNLAISTGQRRLIGVIDRWVLDACDAGPQEELLVPRNVRIVNVDHGAIFAVGGRGAAIAVPVRLIASAGFAAVVLAEDLV